ncbi:hypothetical protein SAMN05216428_1176 [Nitrosospira sp. Nsp11]|nr:hypothetical protein SAMN05216428_1176 [Nitrosospira sp. Nsp11]
MSKKTTARAPVAATARKLAPVISIRQSTPSLSDNCRESIDSLEYLLGLARQGRLPGLMYVGIIHEPRDDSFSIISDIKGRARGDSSLSMLGMLPFLQQDLLKFGSES